MVAQVCDSRYLGGGDQEGPSSRPVKAKKFPRLHLNKWLHVARIITATWVSTSTHVPGQPGQKYETLLKNS
jgi:hypothetical protein